MADSRFKTPASNRQYRPGVTPGIGDEPGPIKSFFLRLGRETKETIKSIPNKRGVAIMLVLAAIAEASLIKVTSTGYPRLDLIYFLGDHGVKVSKQEFKAFSNEGNLYRFTDKDQKFTFVVLSPDSSTINDFRAALPASTYNFQETKVSQAELVNEEQVVSKLRKGEKIDVSANWSVKITNICILVVDGLFLAIFTSMWRRDKRRGAQQPVKA